MYGWIITHMYPNWLYTGLWLVELVANIIVILYGWIITCTYMYPTRLYGIISILVYNALSQFLEFRDDFILSLFVEILLTCTPTDSMV